MTIKAFIEYLPCASSLHMLSHLLLRTVLYTNISFAGSKELKKFKCKRFHNCLASKGQRTAGSFPYTTASRHFSGPFLHPQFPILKSHDFIHLH